MAAARQLGVPRVLPETSHGLLHIDVLLPQNSTPFFQRLTLGPERSIQMLDRRVVLYRQFLPEADDAVITPAILRPNYRRTGLIVTTHDTAAVRNARHTVIRPGRTRGHDGHRYRPGGAGGSC